MEEKKGTRKGVGTSGSHNASMRAILRICCPIRQDVRTQERATLVRPGDSRRGLSQRKRCSVGGRTVHTANTMGISLTICREEFWPGSPAPPLTFD